MTATPTPSFPELPPPPADPGEYLTYFTGHIGGFKFDRDGNLQLVVAVAKTDKYLAMPLSDIRGRTFNFTVHAPRGRRPLVRRGTLAVYDAQTRVKTRKADRAWARARRDYFEGSEG